MAPPKHLNIGVLMVGTVQLLDLSPIDLFAMINPYYLEICKLPAPLVACGVSSTIHYITYPDAGEAETTAGVTIKTTKMIHNKEVGFGKLDILLVPGPDPFMVHEKEVLNFVRGHAEWKGAQGKRCDVLSVCTGCNVLAQAGVMKGKRSSGPRAMVGELRMKYPDVNWDDRVRWVQDENIWSSGGITNGQEMVAAYLRYNFPGPVTEAVCVMADVGEKGEFYQEGKGRATAWFLWQIIRAAVFGSGRQKKIL